jgi:hypothetical protein
MEVFGSFHWLVWFGLVVLMSSAARAMPAAATSAIKMVLLFMIQGGQGRRGWLAWGHGNFIGGKTATDWNLTQKMEKRETCAKIVGNLSRLSFFFQGNYYAISADVAGIPGNFPIPPRP